jgi:hypothetical protein
VVNDEETIDKSVEELCSGMQEALAASAPKRSHRADPRSSVPASIYYRTRLKDLLKRQ